jgi:hypothetical protein
MWAHSIPETLHSFPVKTRCKSRAAFSSRLIKADALETTYDHKTARPVSSGHSVC